MVKLPDATPSPPAAPSPQDLVDAFGVIVSKGAEVLGETIKRTDAFGADVEGNLNVVKDRINDLVNNTSDRVRDVLEKYGEMARSAASAPELPPAIDIERAMESIARAVAKAEAVLNDGVDLGHGRTAGGGMFIASGEVVVDLVLAVPPGLGKAQVHAVLKIEPKPHN